MRLDHFFPESKPAGTGVFVSASAHVLWQRIHEGRVAAAEHDAEAGAEAEEQHAATVVRAERLQRGVIDDANPRDEGSRREIRTGLESTSQSLRV
jgi:hypothetical protein